MEDGRLKKYLIVALNGLLFGVFHGNPEQFFYTTIMGIILTLVVLATKSLYASMYIHGLYNFIVSLPDIVEVDKIEPLSFMLSVLDDMNTLPEALAAAAIIGAIIVYLKREGEQGLPAASK